MNEVEVKILIADLMIEKYEMLKIIRKLQEEIRERDKAPSHTPLDSPVPIV
jgi:hypothetical protein